MDEVDFFRLVGAASHFRSTLVFAWFDWRESQGLPWQPEGDYHADYDYKTNEIVVQSSFGEDRFPATDIYKKNPEKIEALFYVDYYDGPLTGVALFKGKHVWFNNKDWSYDNLFNVWTYELYDMTPEQIQDELYWHTRFINEVQKSDDKELFDRFYKDRKKRNPPDYKGNSCLGEFDECLFKWPERC